MLKPIRKALNGTEYWDTKKKLVVITPNSEEKVKPLKDMTVPQLKQYAADHKIEIPAEVTKKEDIVQLLSDVQ